MVDCLRRGWKQVLFLLLASPGSLLWLLPLDSTGTSVPEIPSFVESTNHWGKLVYVDTGVSGAL